MKLHDILLPNLPDDPTYVVYARANENGLFANESEAVVGQTPLPTGNQHIADGLVFFAHGKELARQWRIIKRDFLLAHAQDRGHKISADMPHGDEPWYDELETWYQEVRPTLAFLIIVYINQSNYS